MFGPSPHLTRSVRLGTRFAAFYGARSWLLQSRAAMPLYEYQCTECEATLEAIQAFSAPPLEECPECGRPSLKKLLSAPAFQFKGSGWYVNDYARKGANGSAEAASNGSSGNGGDSKGEDKGKAASAGSSSESAGKTGGSASSAKSESSGRAASQG